MPEDTDRAEQSDVLAAVGTGSGNDIIPPSLPILHPDELVKKGMEFATGLAKNATPEQIEVRRIKIKEHAAGLTDRCIVEAEAISPEEIDALKKKYEMEKEQVPACMDRRDEAWKVMADLERERGSMGEEPKKPKVWIFLAAGAALGVVFGLIGATTVGDILLTLFPTDEEEVRQQLFKVGLAIAIFIGLVIGTITISIREWAVRAGAFARWGPGLAGFLFALGLGGYRLVQETGTGGVTLYPTQIGIVLSCLEVAILVAISVLDEVLLHAWSNWEDGRLEIVRKDEEIARANQELQRRENALKREQDEVLQAERKLMTALKNRRLGEIIKGERDHYVAHCAQVMLNGFDVEMNRICSSH